MTLTKKTLLIISVILAALIAASYTISSTILLRGFAKLEEENMRRDVRRVVLSITDDLDNLSRLAHEWATRDEIYAFMRDDNSAWTQTGLADSTLLDLRLNLMLFVYPSGQIGYSKLLDLNTGADLPLPPGLEAHLSAESPLLRHENPTSSLSGVILLPSETLLVASRPILTSEGQGPICGTVVLGRYLNTTELGRLAQNTLLSLNLYRIDDPLMPADAQAAVPYLSEEGATVVWSDPDSVEGYALLRDIYGRPALVLSVHGARALYQQGQTSMRYLLLSLLGTGLVFGWATLILLDRLVLSRLNRLSIEVSRIGAFRDLSARVSLGGKDELAGLASDINGMLEVLEQSQLELQRTQAELERRVEERTAELAETAEQLSVVNHIARAVSNNLDLDSLMETVYQQVCPVFRSDAFLVALYDEKAAELDFRLQVDEGLREPPARVPLGEGLTSLVVSRNEPLLIHDYEQERDRVPPARIWGTGKAPRSWLGVPMRIGDRVVGAIAVQAYSPRAYGEKDQQLLSIIADQVAVAVDTSRLYTATRARADELAMLHRVGLSLTSTLDFSKVVHDALAEIRRLFRADCVSLLQSDSWSGELRFVQMLAGEELTEEPIHPERGEGLAGWTLEQRLPVLVDDARNDPRFSKTVDQRGAQEARALMAIPLLTPEHAIGALEVTSGKPGVYTSDDLNTLQAIASTLTVALVNARLYNEIRTLLREREQAQAQLIHAEKMNALGKLVASIAHEINNPLQAVQLCLTLVEEELDKLLCSEEAKAYIDTIRGEVRRISAIVYRMRSFYRPAKEEMQPTYVHYVLESVLDLTSRQLENNAIEVICEWADDLPLVQAKPDHLKQVFLNLVLNAIDAMPSGGTLYVRTRLGEMTPQATQEPVPAVYVEFTDTGTGMSEEVVSHLFEPFFTTKPFGSGLGLSISYGIVQAHNGQITVSSQVSNGSTFTVILPIEQP